MNRKFNYPIKLDIGSGGRNQKQPLEEWIHLDIEPNEHVEIVCDFSKIPLPAGSVSHIHIGDVIEHIPIYDRAKVLCEWNRIAMMGCEFTGATPNLDRIMRDYSEGTHSLEDALRGLYGWGDRFGQIHYETFTKQTLTNLFAQYGFIVGDYTGSPGPIDRPWWLVFKGKKFDNVTISDIIASGEKVTYL